MEGPMMSIILNIDTNVGAAYIQFTDEPIVETVEETPAIQVDIAATGGVVGIELLNLATEIPVTSMIGKYRFTDAQLSALLRVRATLQGFVASASGVVGQAYVPTLQAV
jgi:uncharacterized protein YuzE